jgi:hypothetical protein
VDGHGTPPYSGVTTDTWAMETTAGLGAAVPIISWIHWSSELRASIAWPPTGIRIADTEAGRVGGPSLFLESGFVGTFH